MYVYTGFKTFFYAVRHLDSTASYLPTGLHLRFFRSRPSLFLPSSFSSAFLVLSFVLASTSMLFWAILVRWAGTSSPDKKHTHVLKNLDRGSEKRTVYLINGIKLENPFKYS